MVAFSELRHAAGYTQTELAAKLNVSQSAVSQWERGDTTPQLQTAAKIARLFDCSIDDLILGGRNSGTA